MVEAEAKDLAKAKAKAEVDVGKEKYDLLQVSGK